MTIFCLPGNALGSYLCNLQIQFLLLNTFLILWVSWRHLGITIISQNLFVFANVTLCILTYEQWQSKRRSAWWKNFYWIFVRRGNWEQFKVELIAHLMNFPSEYEPNLFYDHQNRDPGDQQAHTHTHNITTRYNNNKNTDRKYNGHL